MDRNDWDTTFMLMAYAMARRSPDPSMQLGAVIVSADRRVLSTGYNGWPRGVRPFPDDDPRWERPRKYAWMAHAERNAIDNAALAGTAGLDGATLYIPVPPCAECARGIVQVGIHEVVIDSYAALALRACGETQAWQESQADAAMLLEEAGVAVRSIRFESASLALRMRGSTFSPGGCRPRLVAIGPVSAVKVVPE